MYTSIWPRWTTLVSQLHRRQNWSTRGGSNLLKATQLGSSGAQVKSHALWLPSLSGPTPTRRTNERTQEAWCLPTGGPQRTHVTVITTFPLQYWHNSSKGVPALWEGAVQPGVHWPLAQLWMSLHYFYSSKGSFPSLYIVLDSILP